MITQTRVRINEQLLLRKLVRVVLGAMGFLGVDGLGFVLEAGLDGGISACTGT